MLNNDECIYFNQTVLSEPIYVECSRRYLWDRLKRFTIVSVLAITVLVGSSISFIIDSFDRVNQMWLFIFLLLYSIFIGYTINQYILSFHRQYRKMKRNSITSTYDIYFFDQTIKIKMSGKAYLLKYSQISKITHLKDLYMLYTDNTFSGPDYFVIDPTGFSTETSEGFLEYLNAKTV